MSGARWRTSARRGCYVSGRRFDCSINMLYNTDKWDGRFVLDYGPKDIPNIRKILTAKMVKSDHNDINWARMLNIKKRPGARQ